MGGMIRAVVVDDEPLARDGVKLHLSKEPDVVVAGEAADGRRAVTLITATKPDLVFLDVQMPGMTGLEVVQEVGPEHMPATIFATAYDHYAVKAFDVAALDYLLKPFDDERFEQALDRARQTLTARGIEELQGRLSALLQHAAGTPPPVPAQPRYLERIGVEMRGQMRIVPVDRIDFISASGSYAEIHAGEDTYFIREQMQTLEERLDPDRFFRIHRSAIVRLDRIDTLLFNAGGDYAVRLHDGRHLRVSRNRWEELAQRLGIEPGT